MKGVFKQLAIGALGLSDLLHFNEDCRIVRWMTESKVNTLIFHGKLRCDDFRVKYRPTQSIQYRKYYALGHRGFRSKAPFSHRLFHLQELFFKTH